MRDTLELVNEIEVIFQAGGRKRDRLIALVREAQRQAYRDGLGEATQIALRTSERLPYPIHPQHEDHCLDDSLLH